MNVLRAGAALLMLALAAACGGGSSNSEPPRGGGNQAPPLSGSDTVVATSPYRPGASYAGVLRECTYAGSATRQCTLGTLPFIGMDVTDPTIEDVLARTLVSHTWMAVNFGRVLGDLPADVLPLFRSVTAVVIASDVRPAHYDPDSGAIYLDPDFLWLSVQERSTVSTAPDPRSDFGLDLAFQMPWRYVRDNQRLTVFLNADGSRDLSEIREIMGYLLYHELAHAVDFVPPERFDAIQGHQTVRDVLRQYPPLSSSFQAAMPLQSEQLKQLAGVSFLGRDSTAAQRSLRPSDLVDEFVNDGAVQYYAYTTQFEDFATLFESAMMKWHFGYDKDTAITNVPSSGNSNDAIVEWGSRGRLGEQIVQSRARNVGQRIYPGDLAAFEAFLLDQPEPQRMVAGATWGQNLNLTPGAGAAAAAAEEKPQQDKRRPDYFLEHVRIH